MKRIAAILCISHCFLSSEAVMPDEKYFLIKKSMIEAIEKIQSSNEKIVQFLLQGQDISDAEIKNDVKSIAVNLLIENTNTLQELQQMVNADPERQLDFLKSQKDKLTSLVKNKNELISLLVNLMKVALKSKTPRTTDTIETEHNTEEKSINDSLHNLAQMFSLYLRESSNPTVQKSGEVIQHATEKGKDLLNMAHSLFSLLIEKGTVVVDTAAETVEKSKDAASSGKDLALSVRDMFLAMLREVNKGTGAKAN